MKKFFLPLVFATVVCFTVILASTGCKSHITESVSEGEDENDEYDGPDKAMQMEFNKTKDPAIGYVPTDRLLTALDATMQNRQENGQNRITSLNWIERGPNSDVVGPSNGNTRANNGIAAGRIRAVMVDSSDATHKTVFVGGIDGGLWKTTDITTAPANWILVNDYFANLAITSITQDPTNNNIMYFCTGEGVFNADAVRGVGVFKSTNGGATWNVLPSSAPYLYCTKIMCDFQGNVFLATRGTGLVRSTNGGTSWTDITPSGVSNRISDIEISKNTNRLHMSAGLFTPSSYMYTDNPATVTSASWTAPATPYPSFSSRCEIAAMGNTLYALPSNTSYQVPIIYKSTDGGANWAATGGQPASGWASGQAWYSLSCGINPANPEEVIVGGLDTHRSLDGGATWVKISSWVGTSGQYVHADQHNIQWYDGGNKLIFSCDGGIHYSLDKGNTITDRNAGLRVKQFYSVAMHPTTTNYFLAGAQDNGTHQLSNPGLGASVEVTGGDGAFVDIDQDEPQYQFGAYVYNQYRRSTNGGANWSSINFSGSIGQFINPFDYDDIGNKLYAGYSGGQYLRWNDPQTGTSSSIISIPSFSSRPAVAVTVSPYTANRVYFGTDQGRVVKVDAADGAAPVDIDITGAGMTGYLNNIAVGSSDQNLVACYTNYGVNNVWVSTNGGTSWSAIDGNLPDMPVRWAVFNPDDNTKLFIATETGVWQTDLINGASTVWVSDNSFPTVRTDMIRYRPSDRTIAAGTHGRGVWSAIIPPIAGCNPPIITTQPTSVATCPGTSVSFTVAATGDPTLTYQWQVSTDGGTNFTNVAGATSPTYTFTPTAVQNGYKYRVIVQNNCSPNATSNVVTLTVNATTITTQPVSQTVCTGANATFTVVATGANLTYQWQVSTDNGATFGNIAGANAASYTVTAATVGQNGYQYRVIVTGTCPPAVTSNAATLTVSAAASITGQPQPQTVCAPANATFTVTATGGSLSYQWQVSTDNGANFTNITGATSATYTFATAASMNGNLYRVVITSCGGSTLNSNSALLTVNTVVSISGQPQDKTVCAGTSTSFTVTAAGTGLSYQWQYSPAGCGGTFTNISGATAATYTIANPQIANNGGYRVVVSGTCGPVTSSCATLTVGIPIVITAQPQDQGVCIPNVNSATFNVTATGTNLTYQWQVSTNGGSTFTNIPGATTATYTVTPLSASLNGNQYRVVINSLCSTTATTSSAATLTVNSQVAITAQPKDVNTCTDQTATFTVGATGSTITYQWQVSVNGGPFVNLVNDNNYSGVNTATLTVNNLNTSLSGNKYRVIVSGVPCGSVTSTAASFVVNIKPSVVLTAASYTSITPYIRTGLFTTISPVAPYYFKWYKNGTLLPSVTSANLPITVDDFGEYYVVVTNELTGCMATSNKVTIKDSADKSTLFVFPNPSTGKFQVRFYNPSGTPVDRTVTVYDSKGARVFYQKYNVTGLYSNMDISLSRNTGSGTYIIDVRDNSGKRIAQSKIVIQQ